jgi:type IV pilus assembly protein PilA
MIKNIQKRIKAKKGFTLIEIIVVLVILAILVAIALPTMFGYVEDARNRSKAQEARVGYLAAQWVVSEVAMANTGAARTTAVTNARTGINDARNSTITADADPDITAQINARQSFLNKISGVDGWFSIPAGTAGITAAPSFQVVGIDYTIDGDVRIEIRNGVSTFITL